MIGIPSHFASAAAHCEELAYFSVGICEYVKTKVFSFPVAAMRANCRHGEISSSSGGLPGRFGLLKPAYIESHKTIRRIIEMFDGSRKTSRTAPYPALKLEISTVPITQCISGAA